MSTNAPKTISMMALFIILGIQVVFNTSPASAQDCPEVVGRWPYGSAYAGAISGNLVYFGNGTVLQIADISDPKTPRLVGEIVLPGFPTGIALSNGFAYVADSEAGLRIIDVSTPASPVEVGVFETTGKIWKVVVSGHYAYVLGSPAGVQIIDVGLPNSPVAVASFSILASDIAVSEGYLYLTSFPSGSHSPGLLIFDVSTPESPIEVTFHETPGAAQRIDVSSGYAFVADGDSGLRIIDVTTPASPIEVGFLDVPYMYISAVTAYDDLAFVADHQGTLHVIDVGLPSSPVELGLFNPPDTPNYDPVVSAGHVYLFEYFRDLRVIDVRNPSSPVEACVVRMPGNVRDIAVSNGHAFAASGQGGVRILDVSTPAQPVEVGVCDTPGTAVGIEIQGGYAFVADGDSGLRVIDISSPSVPTEVGHIDTPGYAFNLVVDRDLAYVADFDGGLRIINVSIPSTPVEVGFIDTPGYAVDVAISGGYAFVADEHEGLRVIDVTTPGSPTEIASLLRPDWVRSVEVAGGYVFIVDGDLRVIDVSSPREPVEIGFLDMPNYSSGLSISSGLAYVSAPGDDIWIINIATPTAPVKVGSISSPGFVTAVIPEAGYAFVAASRSGMAIARICVPACFPVSIAAAASSPGAGDSQWTTDLGINNRGDEILTYKLQMLPRGEDNTDALFTDEFTLGPNTSTNFVDVWRLSTGGQGRGAINVCVSDPAAAGVTSRTYNTSKEGSFGQTIVGVKAAATGNVITTGDTARLGFLTENDRFRTNLGFMNAGATNITVNAEFFDAAGSSLGTQTVDVLPFSNDQWNQAFRHVTTDVVDLGYIDVWSDTPDAAFLTYASVIDNTTGDPTTIWPFATNQVLGGAPFDCTPVWIAAAASATGAGQSLWATDLGLNNLGADPLTYRFQFLPRGGDNTDVAMSDPFTLGGNQAVAYSDVWKSLSGGRGVGAINVCVDNADAAGIVSRTYNQGDLGTFGQTIVGRRGSSPAKISTGEKARLGFLFENDQFRTNLGFMNAGTGEISITVEFFNMQGVSLGMKSLTLVPFSNVQWNRAFTLDPVFGDSIAAGFVDVWTETPNAAFLTYASVIDNTTGDPTTIWPYE